MSDDFPNGDPFVDPDDPAARERELRRKEREEKRRNRGEKRSDKKKAKADKKARDKAEPAPEPPKPKRTPEQEFWDEDPPALASEKEAPAGLEPAPGSEGPPATPDSAPRSEPAAPPAPQPTGETPRPAASQPSPDPAPPAAPQPTGESPHPADAAASSTGEERVPDPTPPTIEPLTDDWEAPPPREDWGFEDDDFGDEGDPAMAGAVSFDGRGGRGGGFPGALRRHPFRLIGVLLALIVVWFLYSLFQPFHGDGDGKVQVTIPKGSSVSEVGDLLGSKGVIDSSTLFQIRVTLEGKRSDLYAGHFTLAHDMSYGSAIEALSKPPVKRVTTVTIPEGYSRAQAAELVEEDGVPGSYTKATVKSKFLDPAKYGGKGAKNLEGFLFPDTFELKPGAPVTDLVQLQLQDFEKRIKGVDMKYAKSKNLTVYDVLTIASMIEREAGVPKQRKLVASVIYNRLHEGMPLGIDATIRFATGNYSEPLTESELAVDSPYNTRTNTGLSPGPINSPGLDAIEAAAHPAKTKYLFYVNAPNTCGELNFAKTEAEFEADVQKYETAREKNGGNEPSSCGE